MTQEEWIEMIQAEFFDAVTNGKTLGDLADCAYSFLGNPIMLTNERGEIFSKSIHNPPYNDPLWEEFDARGYVPREKQRYISAEYFSGRMGNNRVIIFEPAYISHRLMLYQCKVSSTFTLRVIMLESKRPFSVGDEAVFELFAKTAAYSLKNSRLVREFNSNSFEFFLHELLSGHIDSEKNESEIISYLSLKPGDRLVMLVTAQIYGDIAPLSQREARLGLQNIFTNSISFLFDGHIVSFINLREQNGEMMRRLDRAAAFLWRNKLHCAVSRCFERFHTIPELYQQTAEMLRLGSGVNPKGAVYFAGDLLATYLISRLEREQIDMLCYRPMLEMLDTDHGECISTLYAYVISLGSLAQAAKLLGVHYNTVKYRLQKIRQILGTDLEPMLPALYLSIKVLFLTHAGYMDSCFDMELDFRRVRRAGNEQ